jgi:hypothetical protein
MCARHTAHTLFAQADSALYGSFCTRGCPLAKVCKSRKQVERKLKMSSGRARSPSRVFNRPGRDIRLEEDGREARLLRSGIAVSQHEGWKAAPDSTQDSSSTRHPRPASDDAQADGISPKQVLKFAGYLVGSFREWKTASRKVLDLLPQK